MAKLLSTIVDGFISSKRFVSGLMGEGWRIGKRNDSYTLEVDDIVVRNTMTVFELLISKIRAVKGALGISQASGKIKAVTSDEYHFFIEVEGTNTFRVDDILRCMEAGITKREYWVVVSGVEGNILTIARSEFGKEIPQDGDEIVQFGNVSDKRRQSAIYLHADENGQPAIDVMYGIHEKNFDGCVKVRVGGDIPGTDGLKGFYSENGMIKGADSTGHTVYCLYPDGTAELGDGSALFKPDKSGHIAGGAISWKWDTGKQKYVCMMGKEVILTWDNLSDETKENLKGEQGIPGVNGKNGKTSYLHIKYSNDGRTFTANNGETAGDWIGQYTDYTETDSSVFSQYKWSKVKGEDANLLPWVKDWNNNIVQVGSDYMISPRIFSGTRDDTDGTLTGIALGRNVVNIDGMARTGLFGIKDGKKTFSVDAETGETWYGGELNVNDNTVITKEGLLTAKNANITGRITATAGIVGGFEIKSDRLTVGNEKNGITLRPTVINLNYQDSYVNIPVNVIRANIGIEDFDSGSPFSFYKKSAFNYYTPTMFVESANSATINSAIVTKGNISCQGAIIEGGFTFIDTSSYNVLNLRSSTKFEIYSPKSPA